MNALNEIFPVILSGLLIILVIVLIILVIKVIKMVAKVDEIVEDVSNKSKKLNGMFDIIDNTTDAISIFSNNFSSIVAGGINSIFNKKKGQCNNNVIITQ